MTQGPYPIEILTTSQMARADRLAIAGGVPSMTLMENAAAAITRVANQILQKSSGRRVLVLCGPGNNGGDGYVAARLLRSARIKVRVAALTPREDLRGDALAAATAWDGSVEPTETCSFDGADLVVDALFGSGLARDLEGPAAELVTRLNHWRRESGQHVVSVDIPSGIDGTTGAIRGVAVEADATVTFFRLKSGHLLLPGRLHCGALACAHIGIRSSVLTDIAPDIFVNAPDFWLDALPFPKIEGHKYSRGHALVVSGGASFTGAARLAATAALRAGAGLVTLASPGDAMAINAGALTSVMLREADDAAALSGLLADARINVVALGPGLGVSAATREKVEAVLASGSASRAFVLDADALTSFSHEPDRLWRAIKAAPGPT
ncbi:MAG: NAD(P)H-hydrate epimerase, partial [Methylocystis sp.]